MSTLAALTILLAQSAAAPPPAPPAPAESRPEQEGSDPRLVFGWTAIGVGAAGVLAGAVIGGIAWARYESLDCQMDLCPPPEHDDASAYNDLRIPSGLLLIGGALVAGLGIPFVVLGEADRKRAAFILGPGQLTVEGRF